MKISKKRIAAAVFAAGMTVSAVPFTAIPEVSAETTEIFSDTFEEGYDGWSARGDASITVTNEASHSGDKSLYVSGRTVTWHGAGCAKIRELRAGQKYDLSAWVMHENEGKTEKMNLQMLYKDSTGKECYQYISSAQASAGEWKEIKGSVTIPADATGVTIYIESDNATLDFYIDDISAMGEPYSSEDEQDGFSDDFENGLGEWSGRGDATVTVSTDNPHSGTNCIYTTGREKLWNAPSCNKTLVLEQGGYYKFTAWVRYTGEEWSDTHKFQLYLQYNQGGRENYATLADVTATKGEWAKLECKYMIPSDATNLNVYIQTGYVPDAQVGAEDLMDFYVDDVSAERLPEPAAQTDIPSLKDVYKDYFILGGSCSKADINLQVCRDIINKHYNSLTFGNTLKPDSCLDYSSTIAYLESTGDQTNPQVSLEAAKNQLEFAAENHIKVRGHVLVWHSQTPDWFFKENYDAEGDWVSKDIMIQRLENYIKNMMNALATQYPDVEIYAWDVVNEAFESNGEMRAAGSNNTVTGQSAWMSVFGDDSFIDYAFEFARKYAPEGCKLFYNDYNEYAPVKRDAIYEKAKELKEKGLIDGIGMQSHISMSYPSLALYEEAFRKYNELGLEIHVTELDIDQKSNSKQSMLELAQRYQDVFKLYKKLVDDGVNITAVVTWGISDSSSWIGGYPNLFDDDYLAKEAFYAVADTDREIQSIKSVNTINADSDTLDKAFEVQSSNKVGDKGEFKAAWQTLNSPDEDSVTVQFKAYSDCDVQIVFENGETYTETVKKDTFYTADFKVPKISENKEAGFDIIIDGTAWNDMSYKAGGTIENFGVLLFKDMPKYTEAVYGTPVIDGEADDIWADAPSIKTDKYTAGSGATAVVKTMWDENYIYVLADVTDPKLSKSSINAYEQDSVEIFFDENNNKTAAYQADDIQLRVNYDNEKSVTDGFSKEAFESATTITSTGYIVEFKIPSSLGGFSNNQVVGFDAQVNDDDGSGERTSIANWNDLTGLGYTNTSQYGVMKLVGGSGENPDNPDNPDIKPTLLGDVTLDGVVDVRDVTMLNQYIVKMTDFDDQQLANGDIIKDSKVDLKDLGQLKKYIIKLIDSLG